MVDERFKFLSGLTGQLVDHNSGWCVLGLEEGLSGEQQGLRETYKKMLDNIKMGGFTYNDQDVNKTPAQKLMSVVKPLELVYLDLRLLAGKIRDVLGEANHLGTGFVCCLSDVSTGLGKALDLLDPEWRTGGIRSVVLDKKVLNDARLYLANVMSLLESNFVEMGAYIEGKTGVEESRLPFIYQVIRDATHGIEKYLFESET